MTIIQQSPTRALPRAVADLQVGDILTLPDRDVVVTRLIPATREEALTCGSREVQSGTWWQTFNATEPVTASSRVHREPTRSCEMAGCYRTDATAMSACGTYYVCPPCRKQIEEMTAVLLAEQEVEQGEPGIAVGAAVTRDGYPGVWTVTGHEDGRVWIQPADEAEPGGTFLDHLAAQAAPEVLVDPSDLTPAVVEAAGR